MGILNEVNKLVNGRGLPKPKSEFTLKVDMKYVCKKTISQRKAVYGNSFTKLAKLWSEYLDVKITEKDVAMSLALLKQVRIEDIKIKLQNIKENEDFNDIFVLEQIKKLNEGLADSVKDYNNYLWVSYNYEEYERL